MSTISPDTKRISPRLKKRRTRTPTRRSWGPRVKKIQVGYDDAYDVLNVWEVGLAKNHVARIIVFGVRGKPQTAWKKLVCLRIRTWVVKKKLTSTKFLRRKFTSKLYDLKHKHFCNRNFKKDFHNCADPQKCKCKNCKLPMNWYHDCQFILDTVGANVSNVASK